VAVDDILSRLECVKGRNGSWVARCPAHDDRSPSLSVKELDDGRILMHCFGGCGTDAVLGALGLAMGDLFPEPLTTHARPGKHFSAADALRILQREAAVMAIMSSDIAERGSQTPEETERAKLALVRLNEVLEFTRGS
jgi:hypothetical protein